MNNAPQAGTLPDRPALIDVGRIISRLQSAERVLITTHARADGDAIGSAGGLSRLLAGAGKSPTVRLHEPVPPRYAFLSELAQFETWRVASAASDLEQADLLVVVDTCARAQLGEVAAAIDAARLPKIAIDHHRTRDDVVDEVWVDSGRAAAAAMIEELARAADWPIDAGTATLLFVGLTTDTGWLRFSNTDAVALESAARLVAAGAAPNELFERLYMDESEARARLFGYVLSSFELHAGGRLAITRLSQADLRKCGVTAAMTEDIINEPMRIGEVVASVLLVEPEGGGPIRVSLRSKRDIDVAEVASRFGGGGHARASGVRIAGRLADVAETITEAMLAALNQATPHS